MKVSIVVPVYNVESYIEDCIKSVASQTYKGEIECIIINDCTPDGSCTVIERFIKEYKGNIEFKLLHHTRNRGLSAARNTGIDAATGEYIYFLDSDDEITPDCIELLAEPLKKEKYDFVIGNYQVAGSDKEFPPLILEEGKIDGNEDIRDSYFKEIWYMMAWNKLCNIAFIRKEKLYFKEGIIHEDELWSFKKACVAQTMYCVKKTTYKYKVREDSIMKTCNSPQKIHSFAIISNEAYLFSKDKGKLYIQNVFKRILYFREYALSMIFSQKTYIERKTLYIKHYKLLRIKPWQAYKNKTISSISLIKEAYNYMPGVFGFLYLSFYQKIKRRLTGYSKKENYNTNLEAV